MVLLRLLGVAALSTLLCQAFPETDSSSFPYKYLQRSCISNNCAAIRISVGRSPINLLDIPLINELDAYVTSLNTTNPPKVVVVSSNNPDFFLDHLDVNLLSVASRPPNVNVNEVVGKYFHILDLLSSLPTIFISEVAARTFGGGNEIAMHTDMRFAGPNAIFNAVENAGGVIHVGGIQQVSRLLGPGLASEYLLSSADVGAKEAARVNWVNRAFDTNADLRKYVDKLAKRMANFNPNALAAAKASIAERASSPEVFARDQERFNELTLEPKVQESVDLYLKLSNNQSREWELNSGDNFANLIAPRIWG